MFKKIFIPIMLVTIALSLTACGKTIQSYVEENMSEITKEYYIVEKDNYSATLSVCERESDFLYNGQSTESVDFALLSILFKNDVNERIIKVSVTSGENTVEVEAEFNPMNNMFMADIVDDITLTDAVSVSYDNSAVTLEKKNFTIGYEEALEIACNNLGMRLEECKSYNNFYAECYLRVLSEHGDNFDNLYWGFTCLDYDGESFSIVISVDDGSILAKSE